MRAVSTFAAQCVWLCSEPWFASYFICSNSDFHPMVSRRRDLFVIIHCTELFPSAYPSSTWSYSCHSTSTSSVHSSSQKKDNMLSAKVFLTSLSARAYHFIQYDILYLHVFESPA